LARLAEAEVQFLVVGGIAVVLNGYVRLTEDIDILIEDSAVNIGRLLDCLRGFGEGFARELSVEDFNEDEGAIRIIEETERCEIDIFTRMTGLRYADLIGDAASYDLNGHPVRYASKATLIRLKSGSVREKDRMDVSALTKLQQDPHALD
jgi:hypothetical protein